MLRRRADLWPLSTHVAYFGLLIAAWIHGKYDLTMAALVAGICFTSFQGAVQNHNAVHCPVFKKRWMNRAYQVVLTLIYGHPSSSYVPGHNLGHHKATDTPKDAMRTSKARFRLNILNIVLFILLVAKSVAAADSSYAKAMRKRHPIWFRQLAMEMGTLVTISAALLYLDWKLALLLWFFPHIYAQWGITGINLLQHDGCDIQSEYNHSRNFVNPLLNILAFNNGYHTIHHIRPGLHWSLARDAHEKEVAPHIHPSLEQKSLWKYLFVTYGLNRRLDYLGNPYFPPPDPPDENWIPAPGETPNDLGAATLSA
jgi:fatty acid desaturase